MWRVSVGWGNQLAALKHVPPHSTSLALASRVTHGAARCTLYSARARGAVGNSARLACLRREASISLPQFPTDTRHIWQRPNAEGTAKAALKTTATATSKTTALHFYLAVILNRLLRSLQTTLLRKQLPQHSTQPSISWIKFGILMPI